MIVKEQFIKRLRDVFNLNIYEVKIWTALLSKGISTAAQLSDISNVPRSRSYDILESLEKKGFVIMKLGKPIKYMPTKPENVIKRVKNDIGKQAKERAEVLDNLKSTDVFTQLESLHKESMSFIKPADLSSAIKGRDRIYDQISTMLKSANKSVTIATSEKGLIRKLDAFKQTFKKLKNKGVKVRIIAPFDKNSEVIDKINGFVKVKSIKNIDARYILVDNKEILFMLTDDKEVHSTSDTAVWVTAPAFATALENLMDKTWSS